MHSAVSHSVTLCKSEMQVRSSTTSNGSMHNSILVNVGLRFEATDFPMPPANASAVIVTAAPVPHEPIERKDLTSELERLTSLHQKGALADGEFAAAKARLLG